MDRETILKQLALAEHLVAVGEVHVERQRLILEDLERAGHVRTLEEAKELLKRFEEVLALHIEDRDRLRKMLG
jgi:hypothetical protein